MYLVQTSKRTSLDLVDVSFKSSHFQIHVCLSDVEMTRSFAFLSFVILHYWRTFIYSFKLNSIIKLRNEKTSVLWLQWSKVEDQCIFCIILNIRQYIFIPYYFKISWINTTRISLPRESVQFFLTDRHYFDILCVTRDRFYDFLCSCQPILWEKSSKIEGLNTTVDDSKMDNLPGPSSSSPNQESHEKGKEIEDLPGKEEENGRKRVVLRSPKTIPMLPPEVSATLCEIWFKLVSTLLTNIINT